MAGFASSQISSFNEGEEAFKNQIVPGSKLPQSGGDGGGMGGNIDDDLKVALGGGINIATSSIDGLAGIVKGPKGGIFEDCDIFSAADGSLAPGKLLPPDHLVMAKKPGFKIDVSIVTETGAVLGPNLGFSSAGQGQGQG